MTVRPSKATVLTLACTLLSGCVSTHPLSARSPSVTRSVAPITTTGPLPGHWHAIWTKTLPSRPGAAGFGDVALVGGVLIATSPQGVEALDARTGTSLWRSASIDRAEITAFAISGQQVVIANRAGRWLSVHAPTGRVSWRSRSPSGTLIPYSDKLQVLAASATVPVVSLDDRTIRGIDGRTGRTTWNIGLQQLNGCTPDTSQITRAGSVETKRFVSKKWLAVPVVCGTRNAVVAVDAASGRATWRHGTMTPDDTSRSAVTDRFVGINDDGYGIFEQGTGGDSGELTVQEPSGRLKAVLDNARSYEIWGPLSPLETVSGNMVFPFLRKGRHYFAAMAVGAARPSIRSLSEKVRAAAFDGTRVYGIRQDGTVEVATAGRAAPIEVHSSLRGKVLWMATGNEFLFVAAAHGAPEDGRLTITSLGG